MHVVQFADVADMAKVGTLCTWESGTCIVVAASIAYPVSVVPTVVADAIEAVARHRGSGDQTKACARKEGLVLLYGVQARSMSEGHTMLLYQLGSRV